MTKEEFKEMFVECFSIVVEKESDGFLHVKIIDRDLYWMGKRKEAVLIEDYTKIED